MSCARQDQREAKIEINDWACADGCGTPYVADLGAARATEGIKIAAVDDGFVVTWVANRLGKRPEGSALRRRALRVAT